MRNAVASVMARECGHRPHKHRGERKPVCSRVAPQRIYHSDFIFSHYRLRRQFTFLKYPTTIPVTVSNRCVMGLEALCSFNDAKMTRVRGQATDNRNGTCACEFFGKDRSNVTGTRRNRTTFQFTN